MGQFLNITYNWNNPSVSHVVGFLNDFSWQQEVCKQVRKKNVSVFDIVLDVALRFMNADDIEANNYKSSKKYTKANNTLYIEQYFILENYMHLPLETMKEKICNDFFAMFKKGLNKYKDRLEDFEIMNFIPLLEERMVIIKEGRVEEETKPIPVNSIFDEALFTRIADFLEKNKYLAGIPATDKEISNAEKILNLSFDEGYKTVIKNFGGAHIGIDVVAFNNGEMLGQASVIDLTMDARESFNGTALGEALASCMVFSDDGSGNPIAIDKEGQVVLFDHDNGEKEVLAKSFVELIEDYFHEF